MYGQHDLHVVSWELDKLQIFILCAKVSVSLSQRSLRTKKMAKIGILSPAVGWGQKDSELVTKFLVNLQF